MTNDFKKYNGKHMGKDHILLNSKSLLFEVLSLHT